MEYTSHISSAVLAMAIDQSLGVDGSSGLPDLSFRGGVAFGGGRGMGRVPVTVLARKMAELEVVIAVMGTVMPRVLEEVEEAEVVVKAVENLGFRRLA
jgi:hypothetical protein